MPQAEADWILKAMVVMAAADARLDAREVKTIREIYRQQTGREIDERAIVLAVQVFATRRHLLEKLSAASGGMAQETKEAIVRAAYLTATANGQLSAPERERLAAIAAALGMSDDEVREIVGAI